MVILTFNYAMGLVYDPPSLDDPTQGTYVRELFPARWNVSINKVDLDDLTGYTCEPALVYVPAPEIPHITKWFKPDWY